MSVLTRYQGGMTTFGLGITTFNSTFTSDFALTTAFTFGTGSPPTGGAGTAVAWRFVPPPGATKIVDVYALVTTSPGTARNLTCHVCAYHTSATAATRKARPGASLGSATASGGAAGAALKFVKFTFGTPPSVAVTAGQGYQSFWIVVGDAAGAAGGYTMRVKAAGPGVDDNSGLACYTSTDGFATDGTVVSGPQFLYVIHFQDDATPTPNDYYLGVPFSSVNTTNPWTGTRKRGLHVKVKEKIIVDWMAVLPSTSFDGTGANFDIHQAALPSAAGDILSIAIPDNGFGDTGRVNFPTAVTLLKDTDYYFVLTPAVSLITTPSVMIVDDLTLDPTVMALFLPWGGEVYAVEANAANDGWVKRNDGTNGIWVPRMIIGIGDQVAISTAGGGMRLGLIKELEF